jgi:2'-5' RNA ligase
VIRAFIAVPLDPQIIDKIADASIELKPQLTGVRWIAPENFHLTLKFLGGIESTMVERIEACLRTQLSLFPRFSINAKGLGVFPGPKRPRVLWVGLAGDHLISLASQVECALQPLGFAPETRKFSPHLTIGRWRDVEAPKSLRRQLETWRAHEFGKSNVKSVDLMQSVLAREGASYHRLATFRLSEERSNQIT